MKKTTLFLFLLVSLAVNSQQQNYIIVDRNGTGNFRNIQQAIDSVRAFNPAGTVTIFIKKGFYKEKLEISTHICNVRLIGEDRDKTIINYDDHAGINKMGTFKTYTLKICGTDIRLENLTVENTAAQMGQAVALHVEGDRAVFINCRFLGNQDTVYTGKQNARQYFENCYIEGTTDFIFGPSTAWFEKCTILCKRNSYITAASTPENIKYGYIFNHCTIMMADSTKEVYLGRPWRSFAMTLFMNCRLPKGIRPVGWDNWKNEANEKTARFMEYNNTGVGADTSGRTWSKVLTTPEASEYTIEKVLKGYDGWNPLK
jgi:pectinesterase